MSFITKAKSYFISPIVLILKTQAAGQPSLFHTKETNSMGTGLTLIFITTSKGISTA